MPVRVVVFGAYPAIRAGLRVLLEEGHDVLVVDEWGPGHELNQAAAGAIVVADAGDDAEEMLRQLGAGVMGVVAVGESADAYRRLDVASDMPAAWLLRDATGAELRAAVGAVAAGLTVLDPEVAATLVRAQRSAAVPGDEEPEHLTAREVEVLQLMAAGLPNKGIAAALGISEHTAKFHVGSILGKLGAASRTEAAMIGARRGLLTL